MTQYTWNAALKTFDMPIQCPYPECSETIKDVPRTSVLTRCSLCNQVMEWTLHPSSSVRIPLYWPRRAVEKFSTFDGHPYKHISRLDWSETGGNPSRSGFVDDPLQAVFGKPTPKVSFSLKKAWSFSFGEKDTELQNIFVNQGKLILCNTDGNTYIYSDIYQADPPQPEECLRSVFRPQTVDYDSKKKSYELSCRFPYICIYAGFEVAIWTQRTQEGPADQIRFDLSAEIPSNYRIIGSPTSLCLDGKIGFVLTLCPSNKWDKKASYLCSFVQDEIGGTFRQTITKIEESITQALIYVGGSTNAIVGLLYQGYRFLKIPVEEFWQDSIALQIVKVNKPPPDEAPIEESEHHTITYTTNPRGKKDIVVVYSNGKKGFLSMLSLDSLEWRTIPLEGDLGRPYALSAGSSSREFKGDSNLSTSISVSTENGVYNYSQSGIFQGQISYQGSSGDFAGSIEPSIICNAGVINRVGNKLTLSWKMSQWGGSSKRIDTIDPTIFASTKSRWSGLAFSENRIFTSDYQDGRPVLIAVDVILNKG